MKFFDNVTNIVRDDMAETITRGSRVSIAAACFSKEAEKEMSKATPGSADYRFLKGKIENRSKYLLQAEIQFAQIQTMLDQLGGELRKNKKKK